MSKNTPNSSRKKKIIIAAGVLLIVALIAIIILIAPFLFILGGDRDPKKQQNAIKSSYSHILLPDSVQNTRSTEIGDGFDSSPGVIYYYRFSGSKESVSKDIQASLEQQGFKTTMASDGLFETAYKDGELYLGFTFTSPNNFEVVVYE